MTSPRSAQLPYAPYESLEDRPHVMVDGASRAATVLTLSHWPQSSTPPALARDVSATSVLDYVRLCSSGGGGRRLRSLFDRARGAVAVTNDHFDEDGLMSVFSLVAPEAALAHRRLVEDVAVCGDFDVVHDDAVASIAYAIGPLALEEAGEEAGTSASYLAVLPRILEVLEHPERFRHYSGETLEQIRAGRAALANGAVAVRQHPEVDLAVVSRTAGVAEGRLPGAAGGVPVHVAVVNSATGASRVLAFDGDRAECYLRYESWVKFVSRRVPLRPDLGSLAGRLQAEEPSGVEWVADGVGAVVTRLRPAGEGRTEMDPGRVTALVSDYLRTAEPAWDPFRAAGGYIPPAERPAYAQRLGSPQRPGNDQRRGNPYRPGGPRRLGSAGRRRRHR